MIRLVLLIFLVSRMCYANAQECVHGINEMRGVISAQDHRASYKALGYTSNNVANQYMGEITKEGIQELLEEGEKMNGSRKSRKAMRQLAQELQDEYNERGQKLREKNGKYLVDIQSEDSVGILKKNGEFIYGAIIDPYNCEYIKSYKIKDDSDFFREVPILKFKTDDGEMIEVECSDIEWIRSITMISLSKDSVKVSMHEYVRENIDGKSILVTEISNENNVRVLKTINYVCNWRRSGDGVSWNYVDQLILVLKNNKLLYKYGVSYPSLFNSGTRKEVGHDDFERLKNDLGMSNCLVKALYYELLIQQLWGKKNYKLRDWDFKKAMNLLLMRDAFLDKVVIAERI